MRYGDGSFSGYKQPCLTDPMPANSMKTYQIPNTDLTVSRIGYGCNQLIHKNQDPYAPDILARAEKLICAARDQEINLFDMAAMYSDGKVEMVFGNVLKRSPQLRREVVVQTKCGAVDHPNAFQVGTAAFRFDCSSEGILRSVEGSLNRLAVDRIDILLLHWPDLLLRPEEVAEAFDKLHRDGKVRYFGVSNHTPGQMALLTRYVRQPIVINQIYLGLADSYPIAAGIEQLSKWSTRLPEGYASLAGVVDYCRLNDIQLQAYQPVGGIIRYKLLAPPPLSSPELTTASNLLHALAKQKNTTPIALAMAWLLHHPANILPLTGASTPEHIIESCSADRVTMSRDEWFNLFFATAAALARKAT